MLLILLGSFSEILISFFYDGFTIINLLLFLAFFLLIIYYNLFFLKKYKENKIIFFYDTIVYFFTIITFIEIFSMGLFYEVGGFIGNFITFMLKVGYYIFPVLLPYFLYTEYKYKSTLIKNNKRLKVDIILTFLVIILYYILFINYNINVFLFNS